jgi:hypothetical protein
MPKKSSKDKSHKTATAANDATATAESTATATAKSTRLSLRTEANEKSTDIGNPSQMVDPVLQRSAKELTEQTEKRAHKRARTTNAAMVAEREAHAASDPPVDFESDSDSDIPSNADDDREERSVASNEADGDSEGNASRDLQLSKTRQDELDQEEQRLEEENAVKDAKAKEDMLATRQKEKLDRQETHRRRVESDLHERKQLKAKKRERERNPPSNEEDDAQYDLNRAKQSRHEQKNLHEMQKQLKQVQAEKHELEQKLQEAKSAFVAQPTRLQAAPTSNLQLIAAVAVPSTIGIDTKNKSAGIRAIKSYADSQLIAKTIRNTFFEKDLLNLTHTHFKFSAFGMENYPDMDVTLDFMLGLENKQFFQALFSVFPDTGDDAKASNNAAALQLWVETVDLPFGIKSTQQLRHIHATFVHKYGLLSDADKVLFDQKSFRPFQHMLKKANNGHNKQNWKALSEFMNRFITLPSKPTTAPVQVHESGEPTLDDDMSATAGEHSSLSSGHHIDPLFQSANDTNWIGGFKGTLARHSHGETSNKCDVEVLFELLLHLSAKATLMAAKLELMTGPGTNSAPQRTQEEKDRYHAEQKAARVAKKEREQATNTDPSSTIVRVPLSTAPNACNLCGGKSHGSGDCFKKPWPTANLENCRFEESTNGKQWLAKHPGLMLFDDRPPESKGKPFIPFKPTHRGKNLLDPNLTHSLFVSLCRNSNEQQERRKEPTEGQGRKGQGKGIVTPSSTYVEAILGLLDTGSIARAKNRGNTMSSRFYKLLLEQAPVVSVESVSNCTLLCSDVVCSTLSGVCTKPQACVFALVEFFNEITLEFNRAKLEFLVLEQTHDIIVGNNAIKEHSLLRACPGYIENQGFIPAPVQASATSCAAISSTKNPQSNGLGRSTSRAPKAPSPLPDGLRATPHIGETTTVLPENATRYRVVTSSSGATTLAQIYEKEELLDYEPDDDDIPDSTAPWQEKSKGGVEGYELPEPSSYAGSERLQREAQRRVEGRKFVFSRLLREQPAKIKPLQLVVNHDKWEALARDGRPRQTTVARSDEMKRQVGQMMDWKVIQDSQEPNVSHVHLCKKPHSDELRFTIDYRNVNETLDSMGWPLPNITAMLQRLGAKKPKYFAVLDLTKGYYQAPLAVNSRKFTAFVTPHGTYEWTRVPMGLKNAPAYFQKAVQFEVLRELVGTACEIYIDDIIIFGSTEEEYLRNLAKVLDRLQEHALLVHPGKCKFNLTSVEYVGHVISGEGLHFSREKLQKVMDFPKPRTQKELKGFLGLANYFRDHVEHHSMQTTVLEELARNYSPRRPVAWTDETEAAFENIKTAINDCPQLFFMNDDLSSPIFLHTDASDGGIGAHLFQEVNGTTRSVAFVSKALSDSQRRWSTPEKECYAIYYAMRKLDYLLRDRQFLLRTDHRNLTFLNKNSSPKVIRWKLEIQEYDFKIEYIPGPLNIEADALSRMDFNNAMRVGKEIQQSGGPHPQNAHVEAGAATTALQCECQEQATMLAALNDAVQHHPHRVRPAAQDPPLDTWVHKAISDCHNAKMGHGGVTRTLAKLAAHNVTGVTRRHVERFCRQCPECQLMSQVKHVIHTHPFTTAAYAPMERIAIDTIGPMKTPDSDGNTHIMVVIDCFTRYAELYPIQKLDAQTAADNLLHFMCHYGTPLEILTDFGTQFENELWAHLTELTGIKKLHSMPYSKEENSIVERANKEVVRHLRFMLLEQSLGGKFSRYLPLVQRIYNSSPNVSIGTSPATLLYGNAIHLERHLISTTYLRDRDQIANVSYRQYIDELLKVQNALIRQARQSQMEKDSRHLIDTSRILTTATVFANGSYVLAAHDNPAHAPAKGEPLLLGPYKVLNSTGSWYTVQNLVTLKSQDYHVVNLRPFDYDAQYTDPAAIARNRDRVYEVESIQSHTGDFRKSTKNLKFLVRWRGYGPAADTWEGWDHLKRVEVLHRYLITIKQKRLIPKEFGHLYRAR